MKSGFWLLSDDPDTSFEFDELLVADDKLGVENSGKFKAAASKLLDAADPRVSHDIALPAGFLAPRLALPSNDFAPDYLSFSGLKFVSRRFREAVAQPADVVQFFPVDLVAGGAAAKAQHYTLMRVLARQPAMDLERSDYEMGEYMNYATGVPFRSPRFITRFALLEDLQARSDIFRIHEASSYILVTDALALRVLRAGCTGVEFNATDNLRTGTRVDRYRTVDGVAERRVGFLD